MAFQGKSALGFERFVKFYNAKEWINTETKAKPMQSTALDAEITRRKIFRRGVDVGGQRKECGEPVTLTSKDASKNCPIEAKRERGRRNLFERE